MNSYGKPARKSKAQRELERATEMLRKPGARLVRMFTKNPAEFQWYIIPGGAIGIHVAEKLIERPDVFPGRDGLFPGIDQTWGFS
jgi:hypothetical protein